LKPLSGDPDRLQQVIWNLLSNAVKFTPSGGGVEIRAATDSAELEIAVADTGIGVEENFLPHVFDRFRQFDGSKTRRQGGLGLGLAIVRQLVELHGGTVEAKNNKTGPGAVFTVKLPLLSAQKEGLVQETDLKYEAIESAFGNAADLSGLRILIVDDQIDSLELLNIVLTDCKAEITTANSAREAFEHIRGQSFDLIISDIGMPDEDGFALIHKVRNRSSREKSFQPSRD
jgi:anti-sigma regulatory factor (Ser/Thr protein kinase)